MISLSVAVGAMVLAGTAVMQTTEDVELRDLDVGQWDCADKFEGTAQSQEVRDRNRMKNRWPVNPPLFNIEALDTAGFLKKVRDYDRQLQCTHRSELTTEQSDELDSYENQIVSLTGWLVLAYAGPPETTNCGSPIFHDWHLEISENGSDHPPRVADPTPIICEITPRSERPIYRDGTRIQSLTGFFRLQDTSYRPTGHNARKVRVTGYLLWDDEHNGSADVGTTIQQFSKNGFHHPWRSTAWEIHPIMKIEAMDSRIEE